MQRSAVQIKVAALSVRILASEGEFAFKKPILHRFCTRLRLVLQVNGLIKYTWSVGKTKFQTNFSLRCANN